MWAEYFPDAEIHGIDNNIACIFQEERIHTYLCDASNAEELRREVESLGGNFDLILDDASHIPKDQILAASLLFEYLRPRGLLIIEDVNDPVQVSQGIAHPHVILELESTSIADDRLIVIERRE